MSDKPYQKPKTGDICTAWLGNGFTRRVEILSMDQDGIATVKFIDYPHMPLDWVRIENLS